jgi:hypothetical protein
MAMHTPGVDGPRAAQQLLSRWPALTRHGAVRGPPPPPHRATRPLPGATPPDRASEQARRLPFPYAQALATRARPQVCGFSALLLPGDAVWVPAGWWLHSELISAPPAARPPGAPPRAATHPPPPTPLLLALVVSLSPRQPEPQPSAATPSPSASASGRASAGRAGEAPAPAAQGTARLPTRPVNAGAAALQLARLLEGWALASATQPGPQLRAALLQLADYHDQRCSLRRDARRLDRAQRRLRAGASGMEPAGPEAAGGAGGGAAGSGPAVEPAGAGARPAAGEAGEGQGKGDAECEGEGGLAAALRAFAAERARLAAHPVFHEASPHGRLMMDLYDMAVRTAAAGAVKTYGRASLGPLAQHCPPPPRRCGTWRAP